MPCGNSEVNGREADFQNMCTVYKLLLLYTSLSPLTPTRSQFYSEPTANRRTPCVAQQQNVPPTPRAVSSRVEERLLPTESAERVEEQFNSHVSEFLSPRFGIQAMKKNQKKQKNQKKLHEPNSNTKWGSCAATVNGKG